MIQESNASMNDISQTFHSSHAVSWSLKQPSQGFASTSEPQSQKAQPRPISGLNLLLCGFSVSIVGIICVKIRKKFQLPARSFRTLRRMRRMSSTAADDSPTAKPR